MGRGTRPVAFHSVGTVEGVRVQDGPICGCAKAWMGLVLRRLFLAMPAPALAAQRSVREDIERRERARIKRVWMERWNAYVAPMNEVVRRLAEDDVVDRKLYKKALEAKADLQRCEGWPFKE